MGFFVSVGLSHGKKILSSPKLFVKKQFELWIPILGHYLVLGLVCFNRQLGGMTCSCWHDARIMGNWWDEFVVVSQSKTNSPHIFHLLTVCSVKATGKASLTNWLWLCYTTFAGLFQNCNLIVTSQQNKFILKIYLVSTVMFTAAHQQTISILKLGPILSSHKKFVFYWRLTELWWLSRMTKTT